MMQRYISYISSIFYYLLQSKFSLQAIFISVEKRLKLDARS